MKPVASADFPRPLSPREREVAEWLISNGGAPEEVRRGYLAQLEHAAVVRRCGCGCPSVDFAIAGHESPEIEIKLIGDFITPDSQHGIFVFSRGDLLAGVEIYQMAADGFPDELPLPFGFTPFHATETG